MFFLLNYVKDILFILLFLVCNKVRNKDYFKYGLNCFCFVYYIDVYIVKLYFLLFIVKLDFKCRELS